MLLQIQMMPILTAIIGPLAVAIIMLLVNHFREGSKQYSNRIKTLEAQAVTHENRMTQFQLERENLVDKFDIRIVAVENKLTTVDKLTNEVALLTNEINHQSKAIGKMEVKFDEILKELRTKK